MKHAITMVNYNQIESNEQNKELYGKANWYNSHQKRLLQLVGEGGTLWLVTSRKNKKFDNKATTTSLDNNERRHYSLAYKLSHCRPQKIIDPKKLAFGKYGVTCDPKHADHYLPNYINDVLMDLEFQPYKPIKSRDKIGWSMLRIRELSARDIQLLEDYENKVKYGKHIFISYSSKDRGIARMIRKSLQQKGHTVWMDIDSIGLGEKWKDSIYRGLKNAYHMMVLVSRPAIKSKYVQDEINFAKSTLGTSTGFKSIMPIVLDEDAWNKMDNLHEFHSEFLNRYDSVDDMVTSTIHSWKEEMVTV